MRESRRRQPRAAGLTLTPPRPLAARLPSPVPARAGIGLRHAHHRALLDARPDIGWLEVHSENYLGGGLPLAYLDQARDLYPVSLHGVGLSLGTDAPVDRGHLARIDSLTRRIEPCLISEHVSWSIAGGVYLNDLLPLPYTEEALDVFCANVSATQDVLRRRILVENPSSYMRFSHSTIPEWEFVAAVAGRTGCGILLDVNNVFVSACNHGFDADTYIAAMPAGAVAEIHLAGHAVTQAGAVTIRIDDHGSAVAPPVWDLYERALARFGPVPTLIEWDADIPELPVLVAEAAKAEARLRRAQALANDAAA